MISRTENSILVLDIGLDQIINPKSIFASFGKEVINHDIVLNFLFLGNLNENQKFLKSYYDFFKKENYSMVFVALPKQYADLPESWIFVPTIEEAFNFIQFERIQRDLGF
tara:strand:+ start:450 stop:779 length:330 start_codon:yes stop_codon:yes gene_type:complete